VRREPGLRVGCLVLLPRHEAGICERLGALLGPNDAMFAYSDDVYLDSDPANMSIALAAAPAIYMKMGLRIGGRPGKTELILPLDWDPETFL